MRALRRARDPRNRVAPGPLRAGVLLAAGCIALTALAGCTPGVSGAATGESGTGAPAGTAGTGTTAAAQSGTLSGTVPGGAATPGATAPGTAMATRAPRGQQQLPVYWLGGTATAPALFREMLAAQKVDQPIAAAVQTMTSTRPADPDYSTPWAPASTVTANLSSGGGITVDISHDAFSRPVGKAVARAAIQQLVYTATAAASAYGFTQGSVPVTILVDSRSGYRAWNTVTLGSPMTRDPDALSRAWILDPIQGESLKAGKVTVRGQGVAFENTMQWQVTDSAGKSTAAGFVTTGARSPGARGDFSFGVKLSPGRYTIRVFEQDSSEGESTRARGEDTKTITVR